MGELAFGETWLPTPAGEADVFQGGAFGRVPQDATPFPHRRLVLAQHLWILAGPGRRPPAHGIHPPPAAATSTSWQLKTSARQRPARPSTARAGQRFAALKHRYGPGNVFLINHTIAP